MNDCPSLSECVWVCAYVRPSGCRSTVITSAGGPASPLPTPSPLHPHPHPTAPPQWKAGVRPWSGDRIELMCKNKWLHQQRLEGPQWQACGLAQPKAEHTVTRHWADQANIHTYYTRIHGKTTAGAKGEDEKGEESRERGEKECGG